MRKNISQTKKKYMGMITAAILTGSLLVGCTATSASASSTVTTDSSGSTETAVSAQAVSVSDTAAAQESENTNSETSANSSSTAKSSASSTTSSTTSSTAGDVFTARDLEQSADLSNAQQLTVSDNQDIEITKEGVYVVSGTAKEVTIKVTVTKEEKVQIVLDNANITNTSEPVIYVVEADKVFVTSAQNSTNTLIVNGTFTADGETNTDAVIFSKADTVLNGLGKVEIQSSDNGIASKDDLKVTGGTYVITSTGDAMEANELIAIAGGDFTINSSKDGLHSENTEDNTQGAILFTGGTFNITATDDGIQGTTTVTVDGGDFTISAAEGIESTQVTINNGNIRIDASDDGINTTSKTTALNVAMTINGGDVTINMAQGDTDALDSNGDLTIAGGNITITGPSAFDYDGSGTMSGGTLTVNGQNVTELTPSMMGGGRMQGVPNGGQAGLPPSGGQAGVPSDGTVRRGGRTRGGRTKGAVPQDGTAVPQDGTTVPQDGAAVPQVGDGA